MHTIIQSDKRVEKYLGGKIMGKKVYFEGKILEKKFIFKVKKMFSGFLMHLKKITLHIEIQVKTV